MLDRVHKRYLDIAARAAMRARGDVEPNPMVGAVVVDASGEVIGIGHHRRFGGPHAEVEALADCTRRGRSAAGATLYVTLEPCNHHGKQPPCTGAVLAAKVARVVCARPDPNPISTGGAACLREAGIEVEFTGASPLAMYISDPFIKRITTGLPYVIVKWAQTLDGRIATRTGESKWISSEPSRRMVHRIRSRVDAILTGIGTVRADDPLLTPRGISRIRRTPRRVIIDPLLEMPEASAILRSLDLAPVTIAYCAGAGVSQARIGSLRARNIELLPLPGPADDLDLASLLRHLAQHHGVTTVLTEAGPTTLGSLLRAGHVDEAVVFIAPILLADDLALPALRGLETPSLAAAPRLQLIRARRLGPDSVLHLQRVATVPHLPSDAASLREPTTPSSDPR